MNSEFSEEHKGISRRRFVKIAGISALGISSLGNLISKRKEFQLLLIITIKQRIRNLPMGCKRIGKIFGIGRNRCISDVIKYLKQEKMI